MTMTDFYTGSKAAVVAKAKAVLLLVQYTVARSSHACQAASGSGSGSKFIRVTFFLFSINTTVFTNFRAIRKPSQPYCSSQKAIHPLETFFTRVYQEFFMKSRL
jgi:hypothetical protein